MLEQEELSPTMVDTMEKHRNNVVTQQMVNEGWGGGCSIGFIIVNMQTAEGKERENKGQNC